MNFIEDDLVNEDAKDESSTENMGRGLLYCLLLTFLCEHSFYMLYKFLFLFEDCGLGEIVLMIALWMTLQKIMTEILQKMVKILGEELLHFSHSSVNSYYIIYKSLY